MRCSSITAVILAAGATFVLGLSSAYAQAAGPGQAQGAAPQAGAQAPRPAAPASAPAQPQSPFAPPPQVPPPALPFAQPDALAAGAFQAKKQGDKFVVTTAGKTLTTRAKVEAFMLYRVAALAKQNGYSWFSIVEQRGRSDTVPATVPDAAGPRYSFRLSYWRPIWRVKRGPDDAWQTWSPFSGAPFPLAEGDKVSQYEVTAQVFMHKGMMDSSDGRNFAANAVSDYLLNQVVPAL